MDVVDVIANAMTFTFFVSFFFLFLMEAVIKYEETVNNSASLQTRSTTLVR